MKRVLLPVVFFLLFFGQVHAQTMDSVEMQSMGTDPVGDSPIAPDLTELWMASDSESLIFLIGLTGTQLGADLNITVRDTSNNVYLIRVSIFNQSYSVSVHRGIDLYNPVIAEIDDISVQYIVQHVYYNPINEEIGVFVDWIDLGGFQEVDTIIWSGMPGKDWDRLPATGFVTYSSVTQVDRVVNFQSALAGQFTTSSDQQTTPTITALTPITRSQPEFVTSLVSSGPNDLPYFLLVGGIIAFGLILGAVAVRSFSSPKSDLAKPIAAKPISPVKPTLAPNPTPVQPDVAMKFIPELNREVRLCCYQTARLEEAYCYCGRAITQDLKDLFSGEM